METSSGIGSVIKSGLFTETQKSGAATERHPIVVTVSRTFGSNGGKIAELLAERLGVTCYGHSMIDEMMNKTQTTKKLMSLMDEKLPRAIDSFLYSLFVKPEQSVTGYYKNIIKTILNIAKGGGVIVGRGARLILAHDPHVFRIHIEGTKDVCIKRVAQREGITLDAAKRKIGDTEKERSRFLKGLFKRYPNSRTYYDLVLNSDRIDPVHAVDIIVNAMERMGYISVEQAQQQSQEHRHAAPPAQFQPLPPLHLGLHFLVVEDENEFFSLINGWLETWPASDDSKESGRSQPLHLTHAKSFQEAEEFLEHNQYDLVLLDLNLSDSRGLEQTFGRMNQKVRDTPIIVFTGMDDDKKAIQAVEEGAQDYLVKGQVNRKILLRSIRHALSRYRIMKASGKK
ncbi:MAG: cytidylate kinase family protein [Magnetococcales bacterium]|nr:cytidylate kinase family protein [Magnetococcales bacterium]